MLVWVKIRVIDMLAMYDSWNVDSRSIFDGLQGIEKKQRNKGRAVRYLYEYSPSVGRWSAPYHHERLPHTKNCAIAHN